MCIANRKPSFQTPAEEGIRPAAGRGSRHEVLCIRNIF
jgi:hypothetical protein